MTTFLGIDIGIIVAIIALVSSLTVAVITYFFNRKMENLKKEYSKELEIFKEDPLRGYKNEVRKRLYHEYEPLRLPFAYSCDSALNRIYRLARDANEGRLEDKGWLSCKDGYYLLSTVYTLLRPMAYFRIMQRRLTVYDIRVVPSIREEYSLIGSLYSTFSRDFELADMVPPIEYHPSISDEPNSLNKSNQKQQGALLGSIDEMADSLIKLEADRTSIINLGEFQELVKKTQFDSIRNLFLNFHPRTHPVLWRILITQTYLYKALLEEIGLYQLLSSPPNIKPLKSMTTAEKLPFDWRTERDYAIDDEVFTYPFAAAETYLRKHIGPYFNETNEKL